MVIRILLVLLILLPSTALGGNPLDKAKKALNQLEYRRAYRFASQVEKSASSTRQDLIEAYRIQGLSLAARGKRFAAKQAFRKLLALDPDFKLSDDISPKLRPTFNRAAKAASREKPIRLVHQVPEPPESLGGLELSVTLTGNPLKMVKAIKIRLRLGTGDEEQMFFEVSKPGPVAMTLPMNIEADQISYYFIAENRHGATLATAGSSGQPYQLAVASPPVEPSRPILVAEEDLDPPIPANQLPVWARKEQEEQEKKDESPAWYKSWWFWTTVGVVVAGTTTGVVLGLQGSETTYRYNLSFD